MEEIILLPEVIFKLNQLVNILYDEEYFGFMDTAFNYADNIYDFIYTIPNNNTNLPPIRNLVHIIAVIKPIETQLGTLHLIKKENAI